jgi:predicted GH43/DUF377 family glycosyl hydrolase
MKHYTVFLSALIIVFAGLLFPPCATLKAQTNFVKYADNPILPLGDPGEWDDTDAAYVHVLYDGSMYHLWYSGAPQENTYRIGYATSTDGISWNKDSNNPVLDVGAPGEFDDEDVWLPAVLFDGTSYEMWYTGNLSSGGIGYATATDPAGTWDKHAGPVLVGNPGEWDQNRVFNPIVIRNDTLYQMWYSAESASGLWQTGYATSMDGVTWSKHPNNPLLTVSDGEWDAIAALASSVLFVDGQYHMWYHGTTGDAFSEWEIGYATSPDGINWTKDTLNNPIMSGDPGGWDADVVGFPRVIKDGNRYRMWYTGRGASDIERLGYAEDTSAVVGIEMSDKTQPKHFQLKQNYPNPFNPATTIEFVLQRDDFVTLRVYNLLGEEVAILLDAYKPAGQYTVNFDASQLTSGIYYYSFTTEDFRQTRKMVLLR